MLGFFLKILINHFRSVCWATTAHNMSIFGNYNLHWCLGGLRSSFPHNCKGGLHRFSVLSPVYDEFLLFTSYLLFFQVILQRYDLLPITVYGRRGVF